MEGNIIINGGEPLNDCPKTWEEAKMLEERLNSDPDSSIKWKFDSGFKLDYDGPLVRVSSRFYPPKTHYGNKWDGDVSIYIMDKLIQEQKFECNTIEELKEKVDAYVNGYKQQLLQLINKANNTTN